MPHKNIEVRRAYMKAYRLAHIDKHRASERDRTGIKRKTDPEFKRRELEHGRKYDRANSMKRQAKTKKYMADRPGYARNKMLEKNYGITLTEYDRMLLEQNGKCSICNSSDPGFKKINFSVDHCHVSGKVRALLCNPCNSMLGHSREDLNILKNGIDYLIKHDG